MQRTQILNEITQLNSSKAGQSTDIPTKIIQKNSGIFADFVLTSFNQSDANSIFSSSLKNADITPVFKKDDRNLKDNYRPVSIVIRPVIKYIMLSNISYVSTNFKVHGAISLKIPMWV